MYLYDQSARYYISYKKEIGIVKPRKNRSLFVFWFRAVPNTIQKLATVLAYTLGDIVPTWLQGSAHKNSFQTVIVWICGLNSDIQKK